MKTTRLRRAALPLLFSLALLLSACKGRSGGESDASGGSASSGGGTAVTGKGEILSASFDSGDETTWDGRSGTRIALEGDAVTVSGAGATVSGTTVTISSAGVYVLSGTLNDGQIVVDGGKDAVVQLVLNGASLHCSDSAPIYSKRAGKTILTLQEGTENSVTDGEAYVFADADSDEPSAAIFSKDDLTINGAGALTVRAGYNNGIASKDNLRIMSGQIAVNAADDGLMGRDSLLIKSGALHITAADDGMKATNDTDAEKGFIVIEDGDITIEAGGDGIQAITSLLVEGGTLKITTGSGSANSSTGSPPSGMGPWGQWGGGQAGIQEDTPSAKGLKSGDVLAITGGTIVLDTSDDAIHTNNEITISGGDIRISSGDDGVHADTLLTVTGGVIDIAKSYEGLESYALVIGGGDIRITASDDGMNAAGGNDGSSLGGRPGQNNFFPGGGGGSQSITINGGTIIIDADGDGIDSNGAIHISGGTVLVNGPTSNGNGALDYDGSFDMTGGLLVAVGSLGMAQTPDASSTQNVVSLALSSRSAGTLIRMEDASGGDVATFAPAKTYQSVVICSPLLKTGDSYTVYTGGSCTGSESGGLYTGGSYSGGEQVLTLTVSSTVTSASESGVSGGGMWGIGGGPGGNQGGGFGPGRR